MYIDYEDLEDEYDNLPQQEKVRSSSKAREDGTFTNQSKMMEANRNGALRRYRKLSEKNRSY